MSQERWETGKEPLITIHDCHGDLQVRSWAETAVLIKGDAYEAHETESGLSITVQGSIQLTVPAGSSLSINQVQGDAVVKKVDGAIGLQAVMGDVLLRQTGSAKVGTVHGDLQVKHVDGSLSVETVFGDTAVSYSNDIAIGTVHGDLSARNIEGTADIVTVMGDISLRSVAGDVTIKQGSRDANLRQLSGDTNTLSDIAGDIRLRGPLNPGIHTFTANGDIVLHWPQGEAIQLTAVTPHFSSKVGLDKLLDQEDSHTGHIGQDGPDVTLTAQGRIIVKGIDHHKSYWHEDGMAFEHDFNFDFDFAELEGLGEKINAQVFDKVNQLTTDLESKFGPEFTEEMIDKFARKAEKEAAKIEKSAERAMRQAERAMRQAERKMKEAIRHRPPMPPKPPMAPRTAVKSRPKVSSEEQLKILKMVEKGIISPEEAGTLLEALES